MPPESTFPRARLQRLVALSPHAIRPGADLAQTRAPSIRSPAVASIGFSIRN
jgi:hypothetical protein